MMRRGRTEGAVSAMPIRIAVPTIATTAQTSSRASSMAARSEQRSAGAMVPCGALAGTGVVLAAHLLLTELVLVRRVMGRRGRDRCAWAVFLEGID